MHFNGSNFGSVGLSGHLVSLICDTSFIYIFHTASCYFRPSLPASCVSHQVSWLFNCLSSSSSLCTSLSQYLSVWRFSLISPVFRVFLVYWINACSWARLCLFPCRVCLPVLMTYQCTSKQMKTQHVSQKAPGRVIFVLFVVRMNVLEINYKFWGHSESWSWSVYPSEHSPPWHLLYCSENSSLKPRHCTQRLRPHTHTHTVKWPLGACLQPRLPAYIIRVFLCVSMQWGWSAVCLC